MNEWWNVTRIVWVASGLLKEESSLSLSLKWKETEIEGKEERGGKGLIEFERIPLNERMYESKNAH